jgi:1-phosphatidylinositol-4-phosphate 5-kinase
MLPALSEHYKKNPDSLLAKIFGVFTVKTGSTNEVHLMLMENTLQLKNPDGLKYIFDLKGSLVDRKISGKISSSTTMKDVNFLLATESNPGFINLGNNTRKKLLHVIKADVDFLASQGLMDYSLLLGIETLGELCGEKVH